MGTAGRKRVYELVKEMHSTREKLLQKLADLKIVVKSHMSYLNEEQINALYDYVGRKKSDGDNTQDEVAENNEFSSVNQPLEKKTKQMTDTIATTSSSKSKPERDAKKSVKSSPRIIRRTEIIYPSDDRRFNSSFSEESKNKSDNNSRYRSGYQPSSTSSNNSGLRPGFVRNAGGNNNNLNTSKTNTSAYGKATKKTVDKEVIDNKNIQNTSSAFVSKNAVEQKNHDNANKSNGYEQVKTTAKPINEIQNSKTSQAARLIKHKSMDNSDLSEKTKASVGRQVQDVKKNVEITTKKLEEEKGRVTVLNKQSTNVDNVVKRSQSEKKDMRTSYTNTNERPNYQKKKYNVTEKIKPKNDQESNKQNVKTSSNRYDNDKNRSRPNNVKPASRTSETNSTSSYKDKSNVRASQNQVTSPVVGPTWATNNSKPANFQAQRKSSTTNSSEELARGFKAKSKKDVFKEQNAKSKKFVQNDLVLSGKTNVSQLMSDDFLINELYKDDVKSKGNRNRKDKRTKIEVSNVVMPVMTSITIVGDSITVKNLAEGLKKTATEVIKKLMNLGIMATLNQELDFDTAAIVAEEFGIKATKEQIVSEEDILFEDSDKHDNLENRSHRPPVVVVMGHVDHGKTLLLDTIRKTNVIENEAGGITQHIGAYTVKINDRNMTFLDTPGHEAFTAMRARGAQVTDIAILVVAADDGVMPQTIEAIHHANAANISVIVAINKIDKPGADIERIKTSLSEHGLVPEEWGGNTIFVPVSAKKVQNIDLLLEMVLLTADVMELTADAKAQAKGTVIEARLDKDKGPLATVLVQRGTLKMGDSIITGSIVGRVRAMMDDKGRKIRKAGPSTPVEILGLPDVPVAGSLFYAIEDEKLAKQLSEKRKFKQRESTLKAPTKITLDDLFNQIKAGKVKDLNLIVKADVQGSLEAISQALMKLSNDEVRVNIVHSGVGTVTESDITLAQVSKAIVIVFNIRPNVLIEDMANNAGVDLRVYRVIYSAIDDIQSAMKGMLDPIFSEVIKGHAEIRQIFKASGIGLIAGCRVTDGKIIKNSGIRVIRDGTIIHEGKLSSLKRFKDDVKEANEGFECGLTVDGFSDIKEGDVVECFTMEEEKR